MSTKQLYEKTSEGMKEVSPLVSIEDIYSKLSDTPLEALVSLFNHVKCEWKGSVADTRRTVPLFLRRSGLFITYNNGTKYITEFFSAGTDQITTEGWVKDSNWTSVPDEDYISAGVKPGVGTIGYEQLNDNLKQLFREKVNVTNFPDDEDIVSVDNMLKFKDRGYDVSNFQSKGYVILRKNLRLVNGVIKNILTDAMISNPNTIYEIRYDYNLDGRKIILNKGISLYLIGGDIKNGEIVCDNTYIYGNSRLSCNLSGTFFYEGKADGVDLIETNKGISFKDNITYNLKNNERNKVFLRVPISYKSLMYPKEIIDKYSLTGDDRFMINTDYFLLDNIDLGGKDSSHWIKFGKGCSLTNLGGSIYNGYVSFIDLKIIGKYPFSDLTDNSSVENEISIDVDSNIDLSELINTKLQYIYKLTIRLGVGKYELHAPITIPKNKKLIIIGSGKDRYAFTNKRDYNNYQPSGSFLVFNNTAKKYENISVFSGEGALVIKNTSLYLLEEDVYYTSNDNPKPSDFNTLVLGDSNINGINTNYLTINNCSLFCFTNVGIIIKEAFQVIENTDILYCRTGIKAEINLTGDEQFLNLYIRFCEIGMDLNGGHINITKLWIDEITKYAILLNESNNASSIRIVDLHINHCNYSGIKATSFERAMIVGTINRCGCYYAGFDIKDVPEKDLDKCCSIYVNSCTNSTFILNNSYKKIDDPGVQSNYGQVSSPVIDIIADNFSNNNVFLNSDFKEKIYKTDSQKTYALCKIKTQYNNNFIINNGVECNISSDKYIIETPKIGNTDNRPNLDNNNSVGFDYYDINLKKKILWNGTAWVNIDGTELIQ